MSEESTCLQSAFEAILQATVQESAQPWVPAVWGCEEAILRRIKRPPILQALDLWACCVLADQVSGAGVQQGGHI